MDMKLANAKYMLQVDVQYEKSKLTLPLNFDTFYEFLELQLISMCDIGVTPYSVLRTLYNISVPPWESCVVELISGLELITSFRLLHFHFSSDC